MGWRQGVQQSAVIVGVYFGVRVQGVGRWCARKVKQLMIPPPEEPPPPDVESDPPSPPSAAQTYTVNPGLVLTVFLSADGEVVSKYSLSPVGLASATVLGVRVTDAGGAVLGERSLKGATQRSGVFVLDPGRRVGRLRVELYCQVAAGGWFNLFRYVTLEPGAQMCRVGVNSAWMDSEGQQRASIFRAHSLDLKPGFVSDMRSMQVFRFTRLCNVSGSDLAGQDSIRRYASDFQNRFSTGVLGGAVPGMNPELVARIANQIGVIPWVNLTHKSVLFDHRAFIQQWARVLQTVTAERVMVEISHRAWAEGEPFNVQSRPFMQWADQHLNIPHDVAGVDYRGAVSPLHAQVGVLHFLGEVERVMRPVLGDKLITVLNSSARDAIITQWPLMIEVAGYKPDMIAIATHYTAQDMHAERAQAQLPGLFLVWDQAQRMAAQCGVMLGAYDSGSQPSRNTCANRSWSTSADNGRMMEQLFGHITGVADYACGPGYAREDQLSMLREPGVSTDAWAGFLRGCGM